MTERVLGAVFEVSNTLGAGFLEKVYQRAPLRELRLRGIRAAAEISFPVTCKGQPAGEYVADVLVEEALVIESNVPSVSPTNTPRSVSTTCELRAGVCVCSSISRNPGSSGSESSTGFRTGLPPRASVPAPLRRHQHLGRSGLDRSVRGVPVFQPVVHRPLRNARDRNRP